jgi:hypothetical protein
MSMRVITAILAAAALTWSAAAFAADPVGTYDVRGSNPGGGSSYRGTVIGGTRYVGTGIGNKDFIAVSYKSGSDTGLALYGASGGNWTGIWTYAGGKEVGPEVWMRE